ncbi:MAG TPA: hypothetical protein VHD95_00180 [Rhizomicrobium sp.]|nr:hypothetical protein [Rhizomicrobium sp.]
MNVITNAKEVMAQIERGSELWHVSKDPLPGHWELRGRKDTIRVSWDAIDLIRRHYLSWFEEHTVSKQEGRYTWAYLPKQRALGLSGGNARAQLQPENGKAE